MKNGIVLDSKKVVDKAFSASVKGYRTLEVDEFLDIVAEDYDTFFSQIDKFNKEIDSLKKTINNLTKQNYDLEAKLALYQNKVSVIDDDLKVSRSNLDLLNRIQKLENALYKAGIDPTKIK